jgi:hypothetical protein
MLDREIDLLDPDAFDAPDHLSEDEWAEELGVDWRRHGHDDLFDREGFDD